MSNAAFTYGTVEVEGP